MSTYSKTELQILKASISGWAENPAATLAQIARVASVSRATLHRYFANRAALEFAASLYALEVLEKTADRAAHFCLSHTAALKAICKALVPLADHIVFLAFVPNIEQDLQLADLQKTQETEMLQLITAVQKEGALDPALDPKWISDILDALLFVAAQNIKAERSTPDQAFNLLWRGLMHGYGPK